MNIWHAKNIAKHGNVLISIGRTKILEHAGQMFRASKKYRSHKRKNRLEHASQRLGASKVQGPFI